MSIPESVIVAVHVYATDTQAEECARRVILALANNLPERAVDAALWAATPEDRDNREAMRAALIAALKEVGGE